MSELNNITDGGGSQVIYEQASTALQFRHRRRTHHALPRHAWASLLQSHCNDSSKAGAEKRASARKQKYQRPFIKDDALLSDQAAIGICP